MTNALTVSHVGKAYKRYHNKWARAWEWITRRNMHDKIWVLKDIDFSVRPGEAVGVIGVNGAGKSTLLKIITGTTQPSIGEIFTHGRVAALLELGMGFHPDFTGRQNVLMAGQLLGLSQSELSELMPSIEAFAEIGEYIDRPVRLYSSGMQMRLAFSVATAVRPDLLIVDEALSVGDAYFQHKSFNKIREFREEGTSLLIVSHDRSAIQNLCDRAILLEHGNIIRDGSPEEVMDFYNAIIAEKENTKVEVKTLADGKKQTVSGTGEATIAEIAMFNARGEAVEYIDVGESVTLRIKVKAHENIPRLVLGYGIKDRLGQVIYGTNTDLKQQALVNVQKDKLILFNINFNANLGPGSYSVQIALTSTDTHMVNNYEWRDLALMFNVVNKSKQTFVGCNWMDPQIIIEK
ncbi:ABC transporter ATP-binding protein [Comamonas sediminis]|uniref:ABC transporter ATP-binding protein n=1 Tax=Comamonas sediminis TaxID=1783360 RepID=UPI003D2BE88A